MTNQLFKEEEVSASITLDRLSKMADSKFGLINEFKRVLQYYDEPKLWQYSAFINSKFVSQNGGEFHGTASGVSFFSEKLAILKCLAEAVERYCNFAFFNTQVNFVGTYGALKIEGLDPKSVSGFSESQLKSENLRNNIIKNNSKFSWTEGISLTSGKKILIPSQLIYLSYPRLDDEPTIYPSISTGCAGGSCLSAALVRGICEIIERDAFIIFYLNKLHPFRINLDQIADERIQNLLRISRRYNMEIFSLDITTDILIPTFLSVVVNRTGIGKAVSVGSKSSINLIAALVGSIEETFNTRTWIRTEYESNYERVIPDNLTEKSNIKTRGFLWYGQDTIKKLDFFLKSPKSKLIPSDIKKHESSGEQLKYLLNILKTQGYEVLYKEITIPIFKDLNYRVVKVIIPQTQQFYLNEKYKLLGGKRLYEVPRKLGYKARKEEELNAFPHPFL